MLNLIFFIKAIISGHRFQYRQLIIPFHLLHNPKILTRQKLHLQLTCCTLFGYVLKIYKPELSTMLFGKHQQPTHLFNPTMFFPFLVSVCIGHIVFVLTYQVAMVCVNSLSLFLCVATPLPSESMYQTSHRPRAFSPFYQCWERGYVPVAFGIADDEGDVG